MFTQKLSHKRSITENLSATRMEVGSPYEALSIEAVDFFDAYTTERAVVDLGCGDGAGSNQFLVLGYEVAAVDINQAKLDCLPPSTRTVCQDFLGYLRLQPDESVANVFCHHALEHYPFPAKMLAQVSRTLKPGGFSLIIVPADGELRGTHHVAFEAPEELCPPGLTAVSCETRQRGELEFWCLSRKGA